VNERIRQALRADAGLAPYAEGIYIGASEDQVTLRGPVKTEKDKADISAAAQSGAGAREINNQLQVAPNLGGTTGGDVSP
jgi:osmotically-inducible protein OsmY